MSEIMKNAVEQQRLKDLGYYNGVIDGLWGPLSRAAAAAEKMFKEDAQLIWSSKVSPEFIAKIKEIVERLKMPAHCANDLMACIAWESGETFSPSVLNRAGSGAIGLIQFMPKTAIGLGTTTAELAKMSAVEQLEYVYKYFKPYVGRLNNLGDLYMAILWPSAVGKPDDYVLFRDPTVAYRQNAGIDINKDGLVTRGECLVKVNGMLERGKKFTVN